MRRAVAAAIALIAGTSFSLAGSAAETALLPPTLPWGGETRDLIRDADDPWVTPAERSGLTRTPRYAETMEWLRRLVAAAPELQMESIGRSPEGREIPMVIASRDGFSVAALRESGKPILLAHAGIHSGEIDGKDAGLMLLRDMTVGGSRKALLDDVHLLFIPILNVDGHERFTAHTRMNQRGPVEAGWRTNRRNLNLNRDYAKLDTEELRAVVRVIEKYDPELYLDLHVTDGADYAHDITFGYNGTHGWSPAIAGWLDRRLTTALNRGLRERGHVPGPLIFARNGRDFEDGIAVWTASPRFSNGYGDARHLPTVLVENHSLKPYDQRVLGTYVLLEEAMGCLARHGSELRRAIERDRERRPGKITLQWTYPGEAQSTVPLEVVRSELYASEITGNLVPRWTGEVEKRDVDAYAKSVSAIQVSRPSAYYIPPSWSDIAERLRLHGIRVNELAEERSIDAELYRLPEAALEPSPFEGHARVTPGTPKIEKRRVTLPRGSFEVPTDQELGGLAILLLEPESPDSYFQWGFLLEILNRTEYFEAYAMEPMARAMLEEDPELRREFRQKLLDDAEFAADPRRRLNWFYERTPFYDREFRLYPIVRAQ